MSSRYDEAYLVMVQGTPTTLEAPWMRSPECEVHLKPDTLIFLGRDEGEDRSVTPVPFGELLEAWERQKKRTGIIS